MSSSARSAISFVQFLCFSNASTSLSGCKLFSSMESTAFSRSSEVLFGLKTRFSQFTSMSPFSSYSATTFFASGVMSETASSTTPVQTGESMVASTTFLICPSVALFAPSISVPSTPCPMHQSIILPSVWLPPSTPLSLSSRRISHATSRLTLSGTKSYPSNKSMQCESIFPFLLHRFINSHILAS